MNYCKKCNRYDDCDYVWKNTKNPVCVSYTPAVTNGDMIRTMSDASLAEFIEFVRMGGFNHLSNENAWYLWLKQEAKNEC